jgi:hypothetical protein
MIGCAKASLSIDRCKRMQISILKLSNNPQKGTRVLVSVRTSVVDRGFVCISGECQGLIWTCLGCFEASGSKSVGIRHMGPSDGKCMQSLCKAREPCWSMHTYADVLDLASYAVNGAVHALTQSLLATIGKLRSAGCC